MAKQKMGVVSNIISKGELTKSKVRNIDKHNKRERTNNSKNNDGHKPNIDLSKSHLNWYDETVSWNELRESKLQQFDEFVEKKKRSVIEKTKIKVEEEIAIDKNVRFFDFQFGGGTSLYSNANDNFNEYFKNVFSNEEKKTILLECIEPLKNFLVEGKPPTASIDFFNVAIHMDENTPHIHIGLLPTTKTGKSSKAHYDNLGWKKSMNQFTKQLFQEKVQEFANEKIARGGVDPKLRELANIEILTRDKKDKPKVAVEIASELQKTKSELLDNKRELASGKNELLKIKSDVKATNTDLVSLQNIKVGLEESKKELEKDIKIKQEQLTNTKKEIDKLGAQIRNLNKKVVGDELEDKITIQTIERISLALEKKENTYNEQVKTLASIERTKQQLEDRERLLNEKERKLYPLSPKEVVQYTKAELIDSKMSELGAIYDFAKDTNFDEEGFQELHFVLFSFNENNFIYDYEKPNYQQNLFIEKKKNDKGDFKEWEKAANSGFFTYLVAILEGNQRLLDFIDRAKKAKKEQDQKEKEKERKFESVQNNFAPGL